MQDVDGRVIDRHLCMEYDTVEAPSIGLVRPSDLLLHCCHEPLELKLNNDVCGRRRKNDFTH